MVFIETLSISLSMKCHYSKCHNAECCYAECRFAECFYAEFRISATYGIRTTSYREILYFNDDDETGDRVFI